MIEVKWFGINALAIRHDRGMFMIDPYVSRDREKLVVPAEQEKYLTDRPDFVLMTHSHWDHLADMPWFIGKTDTVLYASKTACCIMRSLGVPEKNLREIVFGEELPLPGGVRVTALESRHMGIMPEDNFYTEPQDAELFRERPAWRCGEVFAFRIELEGQVILDTGSANLHKPSMSGQTCDYLICGISRWKEGFPELITENLTFRRFIPVHHDEFTKPLSEFRLRDDLDRLKAVLPGLPVMELPVLQWTELPDLNGEEKNG